MKTLERARTRYSWVGQLPAQNHPGAEPAALATGALVGAAMLASLLAAEPLGRLRDPLVLVLVLPPLAVAVQAFGWGDITARQIRRVSGPHARVLLAYLVWVVASALLTLDVAAVAAASVGVAVGGRRAAERDVQLGSAILGSNVGSLLFPFSNLTNVIVLYGAGLAFGTYVEAALAPQVATVPGVGALLAWRARRRLTIDSGLCEAHEAPRFGAHRAARELGTPARLAGGIVVAGSVGAIAAGFAGFDVAAIFAVTSALVTGLAATSGRTSARRLSSSIPLVGVAVILGAAVLSGPTAVLASRLPGPTQLLPAGLDLVAIAAVGGLLAALLNNLPAAAFGAIWLRGAGPVAVVAYLLGTNVLALATPHGSLATMLCRSVARRSGHDLAHGRYLRAAWRFALGGTLAALMALIAFRL